MPHYRSRAKNHVALAKAELATGNDDRLRHAALELRFAIEAITYDRAESYKKELPPKEYETWQPKKLMAVLLEIDPSADKNSALAVGKEETYGVPAPVMTGLGSEMVFNLGMLKKHYDALGNHLHVPTLKQLQNEPPSPEKLRQRCDEIIAYLDQVLASPVWNINFGNFATITCDCGATIRKRMPHGVTEVVAECFECLASYKIKDAGPGKVEAQPEMFPVSCANQDCKHEFQLFRREGTIGTTWTCPECRVRNQLRLGVVALPPEAPNKSGNAAASEPRAGAKPIPE